VRPICITCSSLFSDGLAWDLYLIRPLLFLETPLLASPASTAGLPTLIVIHHIIVRSSAPILPLPHVLHEWSQAEYEKWVNEHDETDALRFVESCIPTWEELVSKRQADESTAGEGDGIDYVLLVKTVLVNAGYIPQ
jgi:conserved oligomeric Golgi complex subunit 5